MGLIYSSKRRYGVVKYILVHVGFVLQPKTDTVMIKIRKSNETKKQ